MKIKKKEYQKQLDDRYWEGVNAGIKFALKSPEEAEIYVDRTEALRKISENAAKAFEGLGKALSNIFGSKEDKR